MEPDDDGASRIKRLCELVEGVQQSVRVSMNLEADAEGIDLSIGMLLGRARGGNVSTPRTRALLWESRPQFDFKDYERYKLYFYLTRAGEVRRAPYRVASTLILDEMAVWTELGDSAVLVEDRGSVALASMALESAWALAQPLLPPAEGDVFEDVVVADPIPERDLLVVGAREWDQRIRELAERPDDVFALDPRQFEFLIAELLHRDGYDVTVTTRTRDGGRDILAFERGPTGEHLFLVECKRYARDRPVDVSLVRALYGVVTSERANGGLLVATSYFSPDAIAFRERDPYHLALRDFETVTGWIVDSASGNWRVRRRGQSDRPT